MLDKMLRDWNVKGPVNRSVPTVGAKAPDLRVEDFAHTSKVPGQQENMLLSTYVISIWDIYIYTYIF